MHGTYWLWLAALLACPSHALPRPASEIPGHVVHEKRAPSRHWLRSGRVETSAILPLRVGLTQSNLEKGYDLLMEVSHPDSPKFGQWWTTEDVHDYFAPAAETVDLVKSWIISVGIQDHRIVHHDNKGWLAVDATVEEAEQLLKTTFYEYQHSSEDMLSVGADIYHVPEHLVPHIDYVSPGAKLVRIRKRETNKLSLRRTMREASRRPLDLGLQRDEAVPERHVTRDYPVLDPALVNCTSNFTATCARFLYKIPSNPIAVDGNELGILAINDYWDKTDMDLYFAWYADWVPQGTYPIPALIDTTIYDLPQSDFRNITGETIFDISFSTAMIYPQKVVLYQEDDPVYLNENGTVGVFNTFLDAIDGSYCNYSAYGETGNDPVDPKYPNPDPAGYQGKLMCGVFKPTKVISTSFGYLEDALPWNYQKRQCDEYMKLSLMGTTIVSAAGDYGFEGLFYGENACMGPDKNIFINIAPNNCAYVLSVGATMQDNNQTILETERVLNFPLEGANLTSGAGFSNIARRPSYQDKAVQHYLDNYAPDYPYYNQLEPDLDTVKGVYNRIGRAYPDVSAHGIRYMYVGDGNRDKNWGTSTATPLIASILTLLNQERVLAGKSSIGFVHPVFYSHPEIFNDIVDGNNLGCGTEGFKAAPGWDLPSGLGTPNYPKMRELYLSLP